MRFNRHRGLAAFMAGCLLLAGCTRAVPSQSRSGLLLDTTVTITVYHSQPDPILDACFRQIADFERLFSRTLEGSDVWNLNHAQGQPVTVSEETARLLRLALDYADKSDGALDVTIAPVSSLWDFKAADPAVPAAEELKRAAAHVNWKNLRLEGRTAQLLDKEMAVDLGAVAKGYIADRLEESLRGQGVARALINLGGNIVALGDKNGKAWQVGIQSPYDEEALAATLEVRDKTVVTSGTYERSFRKNGVLYHHILDPRTGEPVRNGLASVTILADGSMIADALSTACFVLGETKGMELIAATPEAEALFIREDGTELRSAGFPR